MTLATRDYATQPYLQETKLDEEAKYEVEKAVRALRSRIGFTEANRYVVEEVMKASYRELVF